MSKLKVEYLEKEARKKILGMKVDAYGLDGAKASNELADIGTWEELEKDFVEFGKKVLEDSNV